MLLSPAMRLPLAVLLVAMSAEASTVTFSVTATNGPFPSIIQSDTGASFANTETITIDVLPDQEVENTVHQTIDAVISYAVSYVMVQATNCDQLQQGNPQLFCGGGVDYQVLGPGLDSGISGGYGGLGEYSAYNDIEPVVGPNSAPGLLYLGAGEYTFTAYAFAEIDGVGATPNTSFGSITGDFAVVDGDVLPGAPEPGLWPLCLLLLTSLLTFSRYRRA